MASCKNKPIKSFSFTAYGLGHFELERWSLKNANGVIFTPSDDAERASGLEITGIDWL